MTDTAYTLGTYTIGKTYRFSAPHQLEGLPNGHQCARLHGHNYTVTLELRGRTLDDAGMLRDFGDLARFRTYIDTALDHRHLNDVLDDAPTAELLAEHLFHVAAGFYPEVSAVTVEETPTSWARYTP